MLCLGLRWGDGDLFHWNNSSDLGDDAFFSVWTSTAPGYFFPEEIAAGRVTVDNLIFGFSTPRTYKPVDVFQAMYKAAEYSRKRLGGSLLNKEGKKINPEECSNEIKMVVSVLKEKGFVTGTSSALHLF